MESVLVLNANYEPLNICNMHKAVCLMVMDKAQLVMNGRGEIRTVDRSYPRPSVIRLETMVHRPHPKVKLTRKEIFRRDNYTCQYCGSTTRTLTIDHVLPRHLDGPHNWENVVTACSICNHEKGGRTLEQSGMVLRKKPVEPSASALYLYNHYLPENQEWEQFLQGW
ncbi:HNH endonuclease [Pelolinea submarina]|uniref:5-methylcytosine-specific restriction endonuclease McrA n=1 Tax=Pelolinea submarina TaxID=913107 RepID=A0A3E0AHV6_9CHLR|nr:HNH endonuclease [Pelolinea submarina]REG11241.1 5-methylcytosine-specific restriction endonuclease McrA [Pelolinea submarina]